MNKKLLKWFIILLPAIAILLFLLIIALIPNKTEELPKIKYKDFTTKDSRVTFSLDEKYKQEEKGEYDLYLNYNNEKIVGVFTYNLNEYEQNSSKEILDNRARSFLSTKQNMKLFKKETKTELEDKTITTVEYSGKTDKSSECVYIISVIDFKNDPNYVVYINEVILKNQYELNIREMNNILQSAKLN
ncbi:MAG: hypothetical protein IJ105_04040 [Bacilli bacterium]|nr:hypothetical protein [Bacilli bacterium]